MLKGPYYLCLDKIVLKSRVFPAIRFIYKPGTDTPGIETDRNTQCVRITYSEACTYRQLGEFIEIKSRYPEDSGGQNAKAECHVIDSDGNLRDVLVITAPDRYGILREYRAEGADYTQIDQGRVDTGSRPAEFLANLVDAWPQIYPDCPVVLSVSPDDPQMLVMRYRYPGEEGNRAKYKFFSQSKGGGDEHSFKLAGGVVRDLEGSRAKSQPIPLIAGKRLLNRFEVCNGDTIYAVTGSNRTNIAFRYVNIGKGAPDFAANLAEFWPKLFPDSGVTISVSPENSSAVIVEAAEKGTAGNRIRCRAYAEEGEFLALSGGADPLEPVPVIDPDSPVERFNDDTYVLYSEICVNGFHMVMSKETKDLAFRQYVLKRLDSLYIDKSSLSEQVITVLCPEDIRLSDYINRINDCGHIYIRKYDPDFRIAPVCLLQTVKANRIAVRTFPMVPVLTEKLLIESSDYITALILELQREYPEVMFYNYQPDADDTSHSEFIYYRAHPEHLSNGILTTPVMSDPIYGDVLRTMCNVEFEYYTHDLLKYNKRRFDFYTNRFISNHTVAYLTIPETDHRFSFSVAWNREQAAMENNYQKQLTLADTPRSQLSFQFIASLTVTIYRLNNHYPVNVNTILSQYEGPETSTRLINRIVIDRAGRRVWTEKQKEEFSGD